MRRAWKTQLGRSRAGWMLGIALGAGALVLALLPFLSASNSDTPSPFPRAFADGGDFNLDFIAAADNDYNHLTSPAVELVPGGLQYDARAINDNVVEQLEAEDFACGDTIVFFTEIEVDSGASGSQTIDLHYVFDALNNGQHGVGYSDIVAAGLSAEGVFAAGQTTENGHSKDGDETAFLVAPPTFDGGPGPWDPGVSDEMEATVRITGLEASEVVIVRVDVRFSCFNSPTGNLHAALASANTVGGTGNPTIQVGQQDIPMLGLGQTFAVSNLGSHTSAHTPSVVDPVNYQDRTLCNKDVIAGVDLIVDPSIEGLEQSLNLVQFLFCLLRESPACIEMAEIATGIEPVVRVRRINKKLAFRFVPTRQRSGDANEVTVDLPFTDPKFVDGCGYDRYRIALTCGKGVCKPLNLLHERRPHAVLLNVSPGIAYGMRNVCWDALVVEQPGRANGWVFDGQQEWRASDEATQQT